ncbi:MAG: glycoside hydrolase family 2 protein [Planctomycetes bacterium]|nr:glycoside hydrolase family 2 protein [Planctomycetota bacterium]
MTLASLNTARWTLRPVGDVGGVPAAVRDAGEIPAAVPGCVHTDLLAAGLIADPRVGMSELDLQWIGRTDWQYRCTFEAGPDALANEHVDLVCDGLDTIAAILLNDQPVGACRNMFHPHRFPVRPFVRPGENTLTIRLRAPLIYIREQEAALGARPVNGDWDPFIFMRKSACNFGWDWGPKVATCGIWRGVDLHAWNDARIQTVRPLIHRESENRWRIQVHVESQLTSQPNATLSAALTDDSGSIIAQGRVPLSSQSLITLHVDRPRLWWPRGFLDDAPPHLYNLQVRIDNQPDASAWSGRVGFREVRLNTTPDKRGTPFTVEINGRPIFCKGFNWIPRLFPANPTLDPLPTLLALNSNMVRVWGGGLYEDDRFYEWCDREGIMVWQDFMFACAMYPEESPYPALIEQEARHQIARLSRHPSVVLWCGGNECIWGYESWGWKQRLLPGQSWGRGYYLDLLPRLCAEIDPTRPYWPNSPWSGSMDVHPNDEFNGDRHTWEVKLGGYRTVSSRFCSEFGHQSPSNVTTLKRVLKEQDLAVNSAAMEHRQRGPGGNAKQYDEVMAEWCGPIPSFDTWHFAAQLLQARAMRWGVEWARVNAPACMGALIWQLNDVWPGLSWSVVDVDGRWKLAAHAVGPALAARAIALTPLSGVLSCFAVNDSDQEWRCRVRLRRALVQGGVLAEHEESLVAPPRSVARVERAARLLSGGAGGPGEIILADVDGLPRTTHLFARDRDVAFPTPRCSAEVKPQGGVFVLSITAGSFMHDLCVFPDRLHPELEVCGAQPLTLLEGETSEFILCPTTDAAAQAVREAGSRTLTNPPFLWCANLLGAAPTP